MLGISWARHISQSDLTAWSGEVTGIKTGYFGSQNDVHAPTKPKASLFFKISRMHESLAD